MSPQTAHSCDGLCGCGGVLVGVLPDDADELDILEFNVSLLLAWAGLLLLMQLGDVEAELDALGIVFSMLMRGGFGLSLLDVDSDRCSGSDERRKDDR